MSCWVKFGLQELLQDQECRDTFNLGVTAAHTPYDVGQVMMLARIFGWPAIRRCSSRTPNDRPLTAAE